jgi:pyruvate,orthophosphate dikinase
VRANADTPEDARRARRLGAEGIGLCRTEHMFMQGERLRIMREMILSEGDEALDEALVKLEPMQCEDFEGIFRAMDGLPVTVRLWTRRSTSSCRTRRTWRRRSPSGRRAGRARRSNGGSSGSQRASKRGTRCWA